MFENSSLTTAKQHAYNLKIGWGQTNYLNYILLFAERETPFNPVEMVIERKLFALAI